MEVNLIAEAFKFLILGMSTVFMFLVLMVLVVELQSKLVLKYFPPKEHEDTMANKPALKASQKDNLAVVAAIAVSLKSYQQSKQTRA